MAVDVDQLMARLTTTLESAVTKQAPAATAEPTTESALTEMKTRIDEVAKAVEEALGKVPENVVTAMTDLAKSVDEVIDTVNAHHEVLEKALDRIEALEKGTAVRKSIAGQDGTSEAVAKRRGGGMFDSVVSSLVAQPNGTIHTLR
jgi:DNA anti-recombination protein RmuC